MWKIFPELSTNPGESLTNQQFTPSTTQAVISTTQVCINTTSSHAQHHNSGHLHHTNISTSNNSKKSKNSKNSKNPLPHITIPKRHAPTNKFSTTDFRLKRLKKSPLPFQHHKAILQPDHNTNPKSSTPPPPPPQNPTPPNPEITRKTQSTSNSPSSVAVATTIANTATTTTNHTVRTSYTSATTSATTTTNISTQTDNPTPALMQLNIPIPSRIHTPSTSITLPLSPSITPSSIAPSPIFPHTLQDLQRLGFWGPLCHPIDNQMRSPSPGDFKVTPHAKNGQSCTLTHSKIVFIQNSSQY